MIKDIVCGQEMEGEDAADVLNFRGQAFYFCSLECRNRFTKEPEQFLAAAEERDAASADRR